MEESTAQKKDIIQEYFPAVRDFKSQVLQTASAQKRVATGNLSFSLNESPASKRLCCDTSENELSFEEKLGEFQASCIFFVSPQLLTEVLILCASLSFIFCTFPSSEMERDTFLRQAEFVEHQAIVQGLENQIKCLQSRIKESEIENQTKLEKLKLKHQVPL